MSKVEHLDLLGDGQCFAGLARHPILSVRCQNEVNTEGAESEGVTNDQPGKNLDFLPSSMQ